MNQDINLIPPEKLGEGTTIALKVCDHEVDMYWKVAIEVLEVIKENNRKGEPTVMVVPYGPIGPYARLAYLVNKNRISLKNCVFINMDEYLNDDLTYIDYNHPLSFRGGMDRTFYSKVDEELNVLPENRIFPEPGNEGRIMEIIEKYGKLGSLERGTDVIVEDGVAKLTDRVSFAGSIATMDRCLRTLVQKYNIPLHTASRLLSLSPAKRMGIDNKKGSLELGKDADLVIVDENLQVRCVIADGEVVI